MPAFKALDAASDVILAYRHNGRLLTPDHVRGPSVLSIFCPFGLYVLSIYELPPKSCSLYVRRLRFTQLRARTARLMGAQQHLIRGCCVQGYPLRIIIPGYIGELPFPSSVCISSRRQLP